MRKEVGAFSVKITILILLHKQDPNNEPTNHGFLWVPDFYSSLIHPLNDLNTGLVHYSDPLCTYLTVLWAHFDSWRTDYGNLLNWFPKEWSLKKIFNKIAMSFYVKIFILGLEADSDFRHSSQSFQAFLNYSGGSGSVRFRPTFTRFRSSISHSMYHLIDLAYIALHWTEQRTLHIQSTYQDTCLMLHTTVGIQLTALWLPETSSYWTFISPVIEWWTKWKLDIYGLKTIQLPNFLSAIQVTIQLTD